MHMGVIYHIYLGPIDMCQVFTYSHIVYVKILPWVVNLNAMRASPSEGAAKQWRQPRSGQRGWTDSPTSGTHTHTHLVVGVNNAVTKTSQTSDTVTGSQSPVNIHR